MSNDMSQWVVLGENFHNAQIRNFEYNLPETNSVYVLANGSGTSRYVVEVNFEPTLKGIQRREKYVNSSTDKDAWTTGIETINEGKSYSVEMDLMRQDMYGKNFTLGDIVSCDLGKYGAYALQVVEAEVTYSGESRHIKLTLGTLKKGVMRVIRDSFMANTMLRQ